MKITARLPILSVLLLAGITSTVHAQIGTGWTRYYPSKTIQRVGAGAYYNNSGGVETFRIAPGDERCEARVNNNYTSGQRQFQGEINVRSGTDGSTVQQVFGGATAATAFQTRAFNTSGGQLRRYGSTVLTSGVYGVWVRENVIHNANGNTVTAYINGSQKWSGPDNGNNTHYNKYGVYGGSGSYPQTQWRNVAYWSK